MTRLKLGSWLGTSGVRTTASSPLPWTAWAANVVDCLNTGYKMRDEKKLLVTYGHDGPWDLDDPTDENRFTMEAWGAQMELRAIQRRNRSATVKTRAAGRPKGKPNPHASAVMRLVARRILADPEQVTPSSGAARRNRAGELAPADHLAVMYGKPARGRPWYPSTVRAILLSEAALGFLTHQRKPVIDRQGSPVRLCEGLWDRATLEPCLHAHGSSRRHRQSATCLHGTHARVDAVGEGLDAGCRRGTRVDKPSGVCPARSRRTADAHSGPVGRADQRSPAKRSFSGMAAPVASWTRTKVSMPISSPNLSLPILRKKMFSP